MKQPVEKKISFEKGDLKSVSLSDINILTVEVYLWHRIGKLIFVDVIKTCYSWGEAIKEVYLIDNSPFLQEAVAQRYTTTPDSHPYKLYQIEDISDRPMFQVVAADLQIEERPY